jgi:hypothetical protein
MSRFLAGAPEARFGHAQAIVRRGEPVQFSIEGEDFEPKSQTDAPASAERRLFAGFRNNGRMPLICPTCQVAFRMPEAACYFAWGCFR